MAITQAQYVDLLLKKVGYGVAKTDTAAGKGPTNESNASPMVSPGGTIYQQDYYIPSVTTLPAANVTAADGSTVVSIYRDSLTSTVQCVNLAESIANETWTTGKTDWVPPQFGTGYSVAVYAAPSGNSAPQTYGVQLFPAGSGNNDAWYFDYQAGILNFSDTNVPTAVAGNVIYIVGARYTGVKGIQTWSNINVTGNITSTNGNLVLTNGNIVLTNGYLVGQLYGGASSSGYANTANAATYSTITPLTTNQTFYLEFANISSAGNSITGVTSTVNVNPSTSTIYAGTVNTTVGTFLTATTNGLQAVAIGNATPGTAAFTTLSATGTTSAATINAVTLNAVTVGNVGANVVGTGTYLTALSGANVNGTVTTANVALYNTVAPYSNNATFYPQLSNIVTAGNTTAGVATNFTFNPGTGALSATSFNGVGTFTTATTGGLQATAIGNITPGTAAFTTTTTGGLQATAIGNATPGTAQFTTLGATGATTLATVTAGSYQGIIGNITPAAGTFTTGAFLTATTNGLQAVAIGNATPGTAQFTTLGATGATTLATVTAGSYQGIIGNITPAAGTFATLNSTGQTTLANATTGGLQATAIGNVTPGTGAFTTLTSSGATTVTNGTAATGLSTGAFQVTGGASVGGNLYVGGNIYAQSIYGVTQDIITIQDPLVYLQALGNLSTYNYDIGFYSDYTLNGYRHTGLARSFASNVWSFFSNLASEPDVAGINWNDAGIAYDSIKAGTITLANVGNVITTSGSANIAGNIWTGNVNTSGGVYGNFYGLFYGTIAGQAGSANVALYSNVQSIATSQTFYPTFVNATTGNLQMFTNSALNFVPSTGYLYATSASIANVIIGTSITSQGTATFAGITSSAGATLTTATVGGLQAINIGNVTPGTAQFTTLGATGATTLATVTAGSYQGIIGNITPAAGTFTTAAWNTATGGSFQGIIGNITPTLGTFTTGTFTTVATGTATTGGLQATAIGNVTPGTAVFTTATANGLQAVAIGNVTPGTAVFTTATANGLQAVAIGNATPGTAAFTTLSATGATTLNTATANGLQATAIGNATPGTGAFTTLSATSFTLAALNGTVIGNVTPAAGTFTTVTTPTVTATTVNAATIGNVNANVVGTGTYLTALSGANVNGMVATANVSYYNNVTATTTNATYYPALFNATSGNLQNATATTLSHNPSTGALSATSFNGAVIGTTGTFSSTLGVTGDATFTTGNIGGLQAKAIGNVTPGTAAFTTLSATGATTLNTATANGLQATAIGNATPGTGAFTTLSATSLTLAALNGTVVGNTTAATGYFTALGSTTTANLNTVTAASLQATAIGNATPGTAVFTTAAWNTATGGSFQGIIGNIAPAAGTFTTGAFLTATTNGLQAVAIGNVTPGSGAFTTGTFNSTLGVTGATTMTTATTGGLQAVAIGNVTPGSGAFTSLSASGATTLNTITAASLQATAIGNVTPGTGAFTTITSSSTMIAGGNIVAASGTASTTTTTGALIVTGGVGVSGNINIGGATVLNGSGTAGNDVIVKGTNTNNLIWARPSASYDQVLIGNTATVSTLVAGAKLQINSTDSILLPVGTTAQQPTGVAGMLRFSSTSNNIEFYNGTQWITAGTNFTVISDQQFNGDGTTTSFTLSASATTAATIVSINGVVQIPTLAYTVTGTTLSFGTGNAPAVGDVIDVRTLTTTATVGSIASQNGYMGFSADNNGAYVSTGTSSASSTTYWTTAGAQVSNNANVSVASANTPTTVDTLDTTAFRSAKYVIQVTNGTNYQVMEALVISNGTTASITTYGTVQTNGNLGVLSATQSGSNTLVQFTAANATNNVRVKKDYIAL